MNARTELKKTLSTDEGMNRYLDHLLGPGNHIYDPIDDVWVKGPGRGFIILERAGYFSLAVVPEAVLS
jgi:hypothetical protein